jgi:hypothetical protein
MGHTDPNDLPDACVEFEPGFIGAVEMDEIQGFHYASFYFGEDLQSEEAEDLDKGDLKDPIFIKREGKQVRLIQEDTGDEEFTAVILDHVKGLLVDFYAKQPKENTPRSVVIEAIGLDPYFLGPLNGDGKSVPGFISVPQPPQLLDLKGKKPQPLKLSGRTLYEVKLPSTHKSLHFQEGEFTKYEAIRKVGAKPCAKWWRPLTLKLQQRKTRIGHFASFAAKGWFGVSPVALESGPLRRMFEASGELVAFAVEGEQWKLYHCTGVAIPAMIDEVRSGERDWGEIRDWAVVTEHLPAKASLFVFKRHEHSQPRLFTLSLSIFKALCEVHGVQGIEFIPRWSEDPKVKVVRDR